MRVLITGASGLLGGALARVARRRGHEVAAPSRDVLDVTRVDEVRRCILEEAPHLIAHCAAFTRVDEAENDPETARAVNDAGTDHVARAAAEVGALLLYPSTDYVFDGRKTTPYLASDRPNPINAYGRSKLAGEIRVQASGARWLIARMSWLYGRGGRNFVDAVLARARAGERLRIVTDQVGRPTWSDSVSRTLFELTERGVTGVVHVADRGEATWAELARATLEMSGLEPAVEEVTSEEWGAAAPRPARSVLDLGEVEAMLGRSLPHWRDNLAAYLESSGRRNGDRQRQGEASAGGGV